MFLDSKVDFVQLSKSTSEGGAEQSLAMISIVGFAWFGDNVSIFVVLFLAMVIGFFPGMLHKSKPNFFIVILLVPYSLFLFTSVSLEAIEVLLAGVGHIYFFISGSKYSNKKVFSEKDN